MSKRGSLNATNKVNTRLSKENSHVLAGTEQQQTNIPDICSDFFALVSHCAKTFPNEANVLNVKLGIIFLVLFSFKKHQLENRISERGHFSTRYVIPHFHLNKPLVVKETI